MSITTGTLPGVRIVDMPDLGVITDNSSVVGEHAGSGRFTAPAVRTYVAASSSFLTIAALRANTIPRATAAPVHVSGYYALNDGGGGTFVCDPADTTTIDNAGTTLIDAIGQRWHRDVESEIDALWFGLKGDLSTDCSAQFASLLVWAAGNPIYFPAGQYRFNSATNYTGAVNIRGAGNGGGPGISSDTNCTQFMLYGAATGFLSVTSNYPSLFRDFQINVDPGSRPQTSGFGLMVSRPSGSPGSANMNTRFEKLAFDHVSQPIKLLRTTSRPRSSAVTSTTGSRPGWRSKAPREPRATAAISMTISSSAQAPPRDPRARRFIPRSDIVSFTTTSSPAARARSTSTRTPDRPER